MITKIQFKPLMAFVLAFALIGLMTTSGAHSQISKRTSVSQTGPAAIKVTAPSARQTWDKGTKYPIRWESRGVPGWNPSPSPHAVISRSSSTQAMGQLSPAPGRSRTTFVSQVSFNPLAGGSAACAE